MDYKPPSIKHCFDEMYGDKTTPAGKWYAGWEKRFKEIPTKKQAKENTESKLDK